MGRVQLFFNKFILVMTVFLILPELAAASGPYPATGLVGISLSACLGIISIVLLLLMFSIILLYTQHKKLNRLLTDNKNKSKDFHAAHHTEISKNLNQPQEKYNELINTLQDGCVDFSLSGIVVNINNAVANIFNCERNDLIGLHYARLLSVTNNTEIEAAYKNIFKTGEPTQIKNLEITGVDNRKRIVEVSASLVHGENGRPEGFRGIFRDVTELIEAEANQAVLQEQLQRAQQIEAIGALAGGIAHDFNNLLMAIQGNASILLFHMEKSDPLYNKVANIEACVDSGAELTRQLLGFAKEKESNPGILNINELVKETVSTFKRTKKDVDLHEKFSTEIWDIEADVGQLKQVVLSLLIHSWQVVPDNKRLFIDTANRELTGEAAARLKLNKGRYVTVTISNFDDRNRADRLDGKSTGNVMAGINAGIGITSSSEIIKSYNGFIEFKKFDSEKISYALYFPVQEEKITKEVEFIPPQTNDTGTVLFVDDEEMIIEVGKPMLEELGYDVLVARGGNEAITVYEVHKGRIDLVILDIVMPQVDGGEVYNVLKKINPEVKTLLSSGFNMDEKAEALIDKGCNGFIQKPFNLKRLSEHIKAALN